MGRAVSQVLDAREDVVVAARFDWGETADISLCDVIIDFSTPDASVALAQSAAERGGPALVIGSTGFTPAQEAELMKRREDRHRQERQLLPGREHPDRPGPACGPASGRPGLGHRDHRAHHRRKVDSPSGTALMLGEAAAEGRFTDLAEIRSKPYDGVQGERETGKIGFSSIRGGGIIGEHTVLFASEDEVLTLSHSAIDRSLFAKGAVAAAAWVRTRRPGLYDMQDVLGFRQA